MAIGDSIKNAFGGAGIGAVAGGAAGIAGGLALAALVPDSGDIITELEGLKETGSSAIDAMLKEPELLTNADKAVLNNVANVMDGMQSTLQENSQTVRNALESLGLNPNADWSRAATELREYVGNTDNYTLTNNEKDLLTSLKETIQSVNSKEIANEIKPFLDPIADEAKSYITAGAGIAGAGTAGVIGVGVGAGVGMNKDDDISWVERVQAERAAQAQQSGKGLAV